MRAPRILPLGLLLAASTLSAQSVITISGSGGASTEYYSTAINTTGGKSLSLAFMVDYLVVGGGGAGGTAGGSGGENTWGAGGGGAGGVLAGSLAASAQSYTVTVGAGGAAVAYNASSTSNGASGTKSVFGAIEALGGGGGAGSNNSATGGVGLNGASGGGGGGDGLRAGGTGIAGQGYAGGTARSSAGNRSAGGGGGGAGGVGEIGGPTDGHNSGVGGDGGVGVTSSITGSSLYYGGGGGGGGRDTNSGGTSAGGTGGTGGGGAGSGQGAATSGTDGLGGGGGGSGADGKGGDGGDGIVIVRYKGASVGSGTGGTITSGSGTAAGYTLHTFSTVGNASLNLSALDLNARLGSTVSSAVTGTGALTVNTNGTLIYTGSATHTGGTNVDAGTLKLGNGGTGGSLGGAVSVASGANLEYNRSGDATFSSLSGSGALTKMGTGSLTLAGTGTFSGSLRHEAGTLRVGSADGLGSSAVTLVGGALSSDGSTARSLGNAITVLDDVTLGDATDSGALTLSGGINLGGGTRALTVASSVVLSGAIANGSLVKAGAGKLVLSGDNSAFTGAVTADAGALVVNNTLNASLVTIASGASLGGSGTLGGDLFVAGEHNPGNSPGIQTVAGNADYDSSAVLNWELAANTTSNSPTVNFDQIVVGGNLTFLGSTTLKLSFASSPTHTSLVDWSDAFWSTSRSWTVFDVAGTTTGFGNLGLYSLDWLDAQGDAFNTVLAGASFSLSQVGNDVVLNYSAAIPEPSTYGLALGGLALAVAAARRRKQQAAK